MDPQTLFKVDGRGKIRSWTVTPSYEEDGFYTTAGLIDGEKTETFVSVEENMSGRDIEEQVDLKVRSRMKKKIDSGYKRTIEEAKSGAGSDASGNKRPMLAHKYDPDRSDIDWDAAYIQRKYDGHRCLICKQGNDIRAYSRNGMEISESIQHILDCVASNLEGDFLLDGELYIHGRKLQEITSLVKRPQSASADLNYIVYDVVASKPFTQRFNDLLTVTTFSHDPRSPVVIAESMYVFNHDEAMFYFRRYREEGYEGAILRTGDKPYECGKRSRQLLKIKEQQDEEFMVIDIERSAHGWARLQCKTVEGKMFSCSAPGNLAEKKKVYTNRWDYIGKFVTVEFSHWTEQGTPFHPIAIRFKEYI